MQNLSANLPLSPVQHNPIERNAKLSDHMVQMDATLVMPLRNMLDQLLQCDQHKGWLALKAKPDFPMPVFGTRRIGKLMPNGELQFTIGATLAGQAVNLNNTIRESIEAEGVEVLARESTSGSRVHKAPYPTFDTTGVHTAIVTRIVQRVLYNLQERPTGFP